MISDNALDAALDYLDDQATYLYICSSEPTDYSEASSDYMLGYKAGPTLSEPTDGATGRKLTVSAITDGVVDSAGTANYVAITSGSELLAVCALDTPRIIGTETVFTLTSFDIEISD